MPATSGSTTQQSTSVSSVAELESIEVDQFKCGDLACICAVDERGSHLPGVTYQLAPDSVLAANGTSVLYTRNSNPAFVGLPAGATPGRWLRTNLTAPV